MTGIQKTVHDGLLYLANKIKDGFYGKGDDAFSDEQSKEAFLEDLQDEVIGKTD